MNGKLLAAAFAMTTLVATPIFAQQSGTGGNAAGTPAGAAAPANPTGGESEAGGATGRGMMHQGMMHEGMMHRGMMGMMGPEMMRHRMMMMREGMMWRRSPRQWCLDRLARRAGRMASVGVRLDLTAQQQPLWDKLRSVAKDAEQKAQQLCNSLKPQENATVLERMDRREQFLSLKLSTLQGAKPAMQALYQALTPEQRAIFDHPHHWR